ncbi:MAG: glycerophosphodiester phosphodiesterase [Gemmatimonadetes bacterium]|nr:glycerophosphodiester phosphodiesterase [Gemmatimonadota bacterium]MBT7859522.1 glycerophosphodiester phosphodiesterase [Gemmatimonadota bacterium]
MTITARASAHRGDQKNAPENTVPAIRLAVEKGAHQIEFDVQLTVDGHLLCLHDHTVDRTSDGAGAITELTFSEARRLDFGGWKDPRYAGVQIPTLEEVLLAAPPSVELNVHLRPMPELAEKVIEQIVAMGRVEQCHLAVGETQAAISRRLCPELKICNMERQGPAASDYPDDTIRMGAQYLQILGWDDSLAPVCDRLHAHGITINYFGTEDPQLMHKLAEAGIDFILTDDLDTCLAVLAEYGVEPLAT